MKRIFNGSEELSSINSERESVQSATTSELNIYERMKLSVNTLQSAPSQHQENADPFKKEFDYFDRHHVRGPWLEKLFDALGSVQPTSTQSERNFSLSAAIVTKKRTKLSPELINALNFLKSYFTHQKN